MELIKGKQWGKTYLKARGFKEEELGRGELLEQQPEQ